MISIFTFFFGIALGIFLYKTFGRNTLHYKSYMDGKENIYGLPVIQDIPPMPKVKQPKE